MRRYAVIAGFWIVFAVISTLQTWVAMYDHGHSLPLMMAYQLAVWLVWAGLTVAIFELAVRVPIVPPRRRAVLIHAMVALAISVAHVFVWMALAIVMQPYDDMTARAFAPFFPRAVLVQIPLELFLYCGVLATGHALAYHARNRELERSLGDARLHALELQLQPHFLFNTLNSVSALVRARQNDEAVTMIAGLSELLRYTLDHSGRQRVTLEEETSMLRRYLEIQRVRFSDRLDVKIDVERDALRAAVPTLILQPLAENAIRHGVSQSAGAGRIEVRAYRDGARLAVEMFNSGAVADDARRGLGLRNTEQRLRQLYGDAHRFALRNAHGGVVAELSIPWSELA